MNGLSTTARFTAAAVVTGALAAGCSHNSSSQPAPPTNTAAVQQQMQQNTAGIQKSAPAISQALAKYKSGNNSQPPAGAPK